MVQWIRKGSIQYAVSQSVISVIQSFTEHSSKALPSMTLPMFTVADLLIFFGFFSPLPLFLFRFPGGESYKDMISRLESVVVDLEQQVIPTLIVSHVSILQMLIAYFRRSPVREAMTIEVPLHTVLKFTPARGGGWTESQHELAPVYERTTSFLPSQNSTRVSIEGMDKVSSKQKDQPLVPPSPIWGDHLRRQSSASFNVVNPTGNYDHIPLVPTLRNVHA
jgi:hypothetical protein